MDNTKELTKKKAGLESAISQARQHIEDLKRQSTELQADIKTLQHIESHKSDQIAIFLKEETAKLEAKSEELQQRIRGQGILMARAEKLFKEASVKCEAADDYVVGRTAHVKEKAAKVEAAGIALRDTKQVLDREIVNFKKREEMLSQKLYEAGINNKKFIKKWRDLQADEFTLNGLIDDNERELVKVQAQGKKLAEEIRGRERALESREDEVKKREDAFTAEIEPERVQIQKERREIKALEDWTLNEKAEVIILKTKNQKLAETLKRQHTDLNNREARVISRENALKRQLRGTKT